MKKIGIAVITMILLTVITTSAIVSSPIEYVNSIFISIGEWIGGSQDNEVVEGLLLFLESKEGNQYVYQAQQFMQKNYSSVEYELNAIVIPMLLKGENEFNESTAKKLSSYYIIKNDSKKNKDDPSHKVVAKNVYIDNLRNDDEFKELFEGISSTTIVNYIERFENLQQYTRWEYEGGAWGYPFREKAFVTAEIGWYKPFDKIIMHNGIDLAFAGSHNTCNKPIYSITEGIVSDTDQGFMDSGRGYYVEITYSQWKIRYFHLIRSTPLKIGQTVKQGDYIGNVGTTGFSNACHLHLEIRDLNNQVYNPRDFIDFDNPFTEKGD